MTWDEMIWYGMNEMMGTYGNTEGSQVIAVPGFNISEPSLIAAWTVSFFIIEMCATQLG